MEDPAAYNQSKWDELAQHGVVFSRPLLELTPETAREFLDPQGVLPDVQGKEVLCLASGGGQQSAAFGVLGARVHVLDLSNAMLERDREAAAHYGFDIDIQQGDMRNLSRFPDRQFDLVWHAYSINFVPETLPVFREVARVLRPGGHYSIQFHNPFFQGLSEEMWTGAGYPLSEPYVDGAEVQEPIWEFTDQDGRPVRMVGPREFRHNLSTVINQLAGLGFHLLRLWEEVGYNPDTAPGTWEHFIRIAPPWLTLWLTYRPELLGG